MRRRRINQQVIGRGHYCKICRRPMRSGAPTVCADCCGEGSIDDIVKEIEDRKKLWKPKQS